MSLHYETVTPLLKRVLLELMSVDLLSEFRLVGGTALSLHRGHRMSVDIDLFTDSTYGSVNFDSIESYLKMNYSYFSKSGTGLIGMGSSYVIGDSKDESVKLDLYYNPEPFLDEELLIDGIRMATVKEIVAMKMDVVERGGRKKDFWDLHNLIDEFSLNEFLDLHEKRHKYTHEREEMKRKFSQFEEADIDPDPICLRGNVWELIKLDLLEFAEVN